ncbi:uncharacterized protein Z518_09087 [Rhinocladiella mackenziei CBS 650.93]|uniref:VWFA domain-containing protein n=1 Tax=Rhinocladiella mackenziei CBS 650.93 TaxID=1442369 RepID=A0A0D2FH55_9EURO|nr:uncharacterized protein Z518_09087 [Rhinocladiella mackenziei CBS 650.93]KIX01362.1 hypothetical protein Z518_09087 [Rhinocladiella mackenziei CBS 650.93]
MADSGTTRFDTSPEDFVMVDGSHDLPLRPRSTNPEKQHLRVELHPLQNDDAFIVSVRPPKVPEDGLKRASCDIVLVIDVSGSMNAAAPLPDVEDCNDKEAAGLSVLDLTKHAARTILETLGENDRLGIVTFSDDAKVVQKLTRMTNEEKKATWQRVDQLRTESCTNLWAGIRSGLNLFEEARLIGNVAGMYILTDGMPNHMCPQQGYVAKLRPMLVEAAHPRASLPTIHTFGFGYHIRSELMQSIAEVGNGNYSFIPDAGMIGTVFVHAVANLYTTMGTSAILELSDSKGTTMNLSAGMMCANESGKRLSLNLGNILFGQSRDILVKCPGMPPNAVITAILKYRLANGESQGSQGRMVYSEKTTWSPAIAEYHQYRAAICDFLSSLFPTKDNGEHAAISDKAAVDQARTRLDAVITAIQSSPCKDAAYVKSLAEDLAGEEPAGQISKALLWSEKQNYWLKWGRHYLPSLLHAHQRQMCNTFKDPGPLLYGKESPLFIKCRDELDAAFDNLPAPKPSLPPKVVTTYGSKGEVTGTRVISPPRVRMSRYNSSSAPCFGGNSKITMADGSRIPIKALKAGVSIWTPVGPRPVVAVVKTRMMGHTGQLCRVGKLWVTPWHPIKHQGCWVFPRHIAEDIADFEGPVYSVMLGPYRHPDGHAIEIGGQTAVTLGHGVIGDQNDVRMHAFFGNYWRVVQSLSQLPADRNGHLRCGSLQRDPRTGLASGFMRPMTNIKSIPRTMKAAVRVRVRRQSGI